MEADQLRARVAELERELSAQAVKCGELERENAAHRRLRSGNYHYWCSASGRTEDKCKHGVDTQRFACYQCDLALVELAVVRAALAAQTKAGAT
jgi:hypothetical protein